MITQQFIIEESIKQTHATFDSLDTQRASELEKAQLLQQINADASDKELARLIKKYGELHPRVQKIQARQIYNKEMFVGLKQEIEHSNIKTTFLDATAWRVHGQVYDNNAKPLQKLTVFLANSNNKNMSILGHSCTDERGYYSITLTSDLIKEHQNGIYLRVSDANKQIIFRLIEPLKLRAGIIEHRDIIIEANDDCTTPTFDNDNTIG
jgi:hypothetical protein